MKKVKPVSVKTIVLGRTGKTVIHTPLAVSSNAAGSQLNQGTSSPSLTQSTSITSMFLCFLLMRLNTLQLREESAILWLIGKKYAINCSWQQWRKKVYRRKLFVSYANNVSRLLDVGTAALGSFFVRLALTICTRRGTNSMF